MRTAFWDGKPLAPVVVDFEVSYNQLFKRLTGRRSCPVDGKIYNIYFQPPKVADKCDECGSPLSVRKDDTEEAITVRLKSYQDQTKPLADYYQQQGRLRVIDGEQPTDAVTEKTIAAIEAGR